MKQSLEILRNLMIGDTIEVQGLRLQCRKATNGCGECYFAEHRIPMPLYPDQCAVMRYCMSAKRTDRESVRYIQLTKEENDNDTQDHHRPA